MSLKKTTTLVFLIAVFLSCGFFRDYLFLNFNEQLRVSYYHDHDSSLALGMKFIGSFSYAQLYYIKWGLTFFFSFLFMVLTLAFVKLFFQERKYLKWTILVYLLLISIAALFWTGGYLLHTSEKGYIISRFLMGMAQGPIVLMVLIPAFRLMRTHSTKQAA